MSLSQEQIDQILTALGVHPGPEDAFTSAELSQVLGVPQRKLLPALKTLYAQGKIDVVRVNRPGLGRVANVTGYRFSNGG